MAATTTTTSSNILPQNNNSYDSSPIEPWQTAFMRLQQHAMLAAAAAKEKEKEVADDLSIKPIVKNESDNLVSHFFSSTNQNWIQTSIQSSNSSPDTLRKSKTPELTSPTNAHSTSPRSKRKQAQPQQIALGGMTHLFNIITHCQVKSMSHCRKRPESHRHCPIQMIVNWMVQIV